MAIDWKKVLIGYMAGVLRREGIDYAGDSLGLGKEERDALQSVKRDAGRVFEDYLLTGREVA